MRSPKKDWIIMWRGVKIIVAFVILFTGTLIFIKSLDYYVPDFRRGYLSDKKEVFDGIFKYGLFAHIITAPIILFSGLSQILLRYEIRMKKLHKILGSVYAYLILFVSAPGAFVISFYAFGGWASKISFITLTILWIWFTYKGLQHGKRSEVLQHKNFMIRSYVLTVSAINLRIFSFIFIHYFHFQGKLTYTVTSWLSWLPFLIVTELLLGNKKKDKLNLSFKN